jgi:hypothetical protein
LRLILDLFLAWSRPEDPKRGPKRRSKRVKRLVLGHFEGSVLRWFHFEAHFRPVFSLVLTRGSKRGSKRVVKKGVKKGLFWVDFGGLRKTTTVLGSKVKGRVRKRMRSSYGRRPLARRPICTHFRRFP